MQLHSYLIKGLNKIKLLRLLNVSTRIIINNKSFRVPLYGNLGYGNLFLSEMWMIGLFQNMFSKNKDNVVFVDVGVNIGQTLLKVKSYSDSWKYVGFEPNPSCIHYLQKLIKINEWCDVDILPVGLSSKNSFLQLNFFHDDPTDSTASIISDFRKGVLDSTTIFTVDSEVVENYFREQKIGFIKIDVEGAELEVIENLNNIIRRDEPFILLEILPVYNKNNLMRKQRQDKIQVYFKQLNYCILRITKDINNCFTHLEKIDDIGIHDNLGWCDYLIIPYTKLNQIAHLLKNNNN